MSEEMFGLDVVKMHRAWIEIIFGAGLILVVVADARAQPTTPINPAKPTEFRSIDMSMTQLLDKGWTVVSLGAGLGGYAYLLRHNEKWVTCAVSPAQNDPRKFLSQCMAMN